MTHNKNQSRGKDNQSTEWSPDSAVQDGAPVHDAFISYSRQNREFAAALEAALERFTPPRGILVPQRPIDVFRDENDFTGTAYYEALENHLNASRTLIVICSPDAARSPFVNDEVKRFAQISPDRCARIIPVLYRGLPNNEIREEQADLAAFPPALCDIHDMPLAVNYLGFETAKHKVNQGEFLNSWYSLLANIYSVSRADIE